MRLHLPRKSVPFHNPWKTRNKNNTTTPPAGTIAVLVETDRASGLWQEQPAYRNLSSKIRRTTGSHHYWVGVPPNIWCISKLISIAVYYIYIYIFSLISIFYIFYYCISNIYIHFTYYTVYQCKCIYIYIYFRSTLKATMVGPVSFERIYGAGPL